MNPINLNYAITTGRWSRDNGVIVAEGWSGRGEGKNNPAMVDVHGVDMDHPAGPLPPGMYQVGPWATTRDEATACGYPAHLGLLIARLTQIEGETYGRSGFFIHGPSMANYGEESLGCTVVPHDPRVVLMSILPEGSTVTVTA